MVSTVCPTSLALSCAPSGARQLLRLVGPPSRRARSRKADPLSGLRPCRTRAPSLRHERRTTQTRKMEPGSRDRASHAPTGAQHVHPRDGGPALGHRGSTDQPSGSCEGTPLRWCRIANCRSRSRPKSTPAIAPVEHALDGSSQPASRVRRDWEPLSMRKPERAGVRAGSASVGPTSLRRSGQLRPDPLLQAIVPSSLRKPAQPPGPPAHERGACG